MAGKQIKKGKNKPLLYIQHLDLYKLQHVQRSVIVRQSRQIKETQANEMDHNENDEPILEEINAGEQYNEQTDIEEGNEQEQSDEQEQNDEQYAESASNTWQNKAFGDMNIEEKIYFLLNRPHYIPGVKCIVKTEKSSYVGVVSSYENGVLQMVVPNQIGNFSLGIEEIMSIRIMGL
ncbi:hypothetical protein CON64_05645 [Bacillus pseudomycoides]|nr:hypothetical protein CON64_05645 [Bacillus pseudomycoides]